MKVLVRRLFPCPSADRWRRFESVMKECLGELRHEVQELDLDPDFPPDPHADFRIYAHKTRREAPWVDLHYKEMHMKGLFTIDPQGWGFDHSASASLPDLEETPLDEARAFCFGLRNSFLANGMSKHLQPALGEIEQDLLPFVLVPLQLPTDDTIMHHSPVSVIDFIHLTAEWAESAKQKIVIKLHPGTYIPEVAEVARSRASGSRFVFLRDSNIHSLIAASTGVLVINSGVGFESLIHGKPVAVLGRCDYQWIVYRADPKRLGEALRYMRGYTPKQQDSGFRFIHHYYHRHAYFTGAPDVHAPKARLLQYLEQHLRD